MGSSDKGRHWLEIKGKQEVSLEHFFADSSLLQCHASRDTAVSLCGHSFFWLDGREVPPPNL